jgi:hypothetical protein
MSKDGRERETIKSLKSRRRNRPCDGLLDIDRGHEALIEDIDCGNDLTDAGIHLCLDCAGYKPLGRTL